MHHGNYFYSKSKVNNRKANEIELIRNAIFGDNNAFIEVMKIYKFYLYRTAYTYVKDEDKSLEIYQDCIYKAFLNIKKVKEPTYFKTWITRILINCALNMIKNSSSIEYLDDNTVLTNNYESISIEEKLDLYNAIDLLREDYKSVIILKYFNDFSVESIANILEVPENTVKTHLKRAKESLSKFLKEGYLHE